jgi:hypothetical protein
VFSIAPVDWRKGVESSRPVSIWYDHRFNTPTYSRI